ncbi:MAG: DUF2059 domain-containing protein [Maritimibacter sp.]|jgi:hypothetical protein
MRRLVLAAALAFTTALPAAADELENLVDQYVNLPSNQSMLDSMLSPEMMAQQIAMSMPPEANLSDDKIARLGDLMAGKMQELRPDMVEAMKTAMVAHFTTEELEALLEFYQKDAGASAMSKMQPYMADFTAQIMPKFSAMQQQMLPEIIAIIEE